VASPEWDQMFEASMESIRTRLEDKEAIPWALVATDSEGNYYLVELNSAGPHFVQRLLVQTTIKLQEWIDRHPQFVQIPVDPQGGPQE